MPPRLCGSSCSSRARAARSCATRRENDPLHAENTPVQLSKKMPPRRAGTYGCADPRFRRALTDAPRPGRGPAIVLVLGTSMTLGRGLGTECAAPFDGGAKRCAWPARPSGGSTRRTARGASSSSTRGAARRRAARPRARSCRCSASSSDVPRVAVALLDFVAVDGNSGRRVGTPEGGHGTSLMRCARVRADLPVLSVQTFCMNHYQRAREQRARRKPARPRRTRASRARGARAR